VVCKKDVVSRVASELDIQKKTTEEVIDAVAAVITECLQDGEEVWFAGFGTFRVSDRAPRIGRNPHTGEAIEIPARRVPTFTAAKGFKNKF